MKKTQLRKIVFFLLALSATPSVYASELSVTPSMVPNAVRIDISFTTPNAAVMQMGFTTSADQDCGNAANASYQGGLSFPLGTTSPKVAYFNGYLPAIADQLCISTSGTIGLDGVVLDGGVQCSGYTGCYSYTCDHTGPGAIITSITPLDPAVPFTATCP